jgi:hypothetical protein
MRPARDLFRAGKCDVGAEADHAEAGGSALAAAETGAGFEFAFEGYGERYDDQVGGSVERDGENSQRGELEEEVTAFRRDKLRNEGEEEESGFGIEGFGQDALAEGVTGSGSVGGELGIAGAYHFDAEEYEIRGAGVLDGVESDGRSRENCGYAECRGEDVEEPTEECAKGGFEAFAAAPGEGAGENVKDTGAGSDGKKNGGGEEEYEAMRIEHGMKSINVEKQKSTSAEGQAAKGIIRGRS